MKLSDLFTAPPNGALDPPKTWTSVGAAVLSAAFIRVAWARGLTWDDYIGYAIGLAIMTTPALSAKIVGLRYGRPDPPATPPGGPTP